MSTRFFVLINSDSEENADLKYIRIDHAKRDVWLISKTCVKRPLENRQNKDLNNNW